MSAEFAKGLGVVVDGSVMAAKGEQKVYTLPEVARHNTVKDCWIIVHGKVYDVTRFLEEHPGGDEVLLATTGADATKDFEDTGHSDSAKDMMGQYVIGDIDASTMSLKSTFITARNPQYNHDKTGEFIVKILMFLVPLAILALAVAARFLTKKEELPNL